MNRTTKIAAALACLSFTACVSKGRYDDAVRSADQARADLTQRARSDDEQLDALRRRLAELELGRTSMQKELDDAAEVDERLSNEIDKLGGDSQAMRSANGKLAEALDSARRRLEEMRRAQAAAQDRAALYRDLALKLKGMIDAGDLAIRLRDGRMVLTMSNDVLFDSGQAQLKAAGRRALGELASVLRTVPDRRFQVAGHTDNEPIRLSPFHTNWDLSTARAVEVVGFLVSKGLEARSLSAAGYSEFDPVDTNETREGRARNRRTELTLQPNIGEMVDVPGSP
jgi:chemotaxis protein MotB